MVDVENILHEESAGDLTSGDIEAGLPTPTERTTPPAPEIGTGTGAAVPDRAQWLRACCPVWRDPRRHGMPLCPAWYGRASSREVPRRSTPAQVCPRPTMAQRYVGASQNAERHTERRTGIRTARHIRSRHQKGVGVCDRNQLRLEELLLLVAPHSVEVEHHGHGLVRRAASLHIHPKPGRRDALRLAPLTDAVPCALGPRPRVSRAGASEPGTRLRNATTNGSPVTLHYAAPISRPVSRPTESLRDSDIRPSSYRV